MKSAIQRLRMLWKAFNVLVFGEVLIVDIFLWHLSEDSLQCSVVHPDPDPAGSEIICKLGSGSVINFGSGFGSGFESGSKLSSASN